MGNCHEVLTGKGWGLVRYKAEQVGKKNVRKNLSIHLDFILKTT